MREREEGPLDFRRRSAAVERTDPRRRRPPHAAAARNVAEARSVCKGGAGHERRRDPAALRRHREGTPEARRLPNITIEQLKSMVQKQSDLVREKYHVDVVAFRVDVVDGKVKLKAKPIQE